MKERLLTMASGFVLFAFLLYQLLIPVLGWHNTKGLIVVNLLFFCIDRVFHY